MFIAISGISASGKNTIMKKLMEIRPNIKILEYSSCTTREPRDTDKEFNTYVYKTKEEFEKGIEEGIFIEYELVHGNYYGTLKSAFEIVMNDKENHYIRDIDVKGTLNLKKYLHDKTKMVSIFLDAPNDILRERLVLRGEPADRIEVRLSRGELERSYKPEYDLNIDNIDMQTTIKTILDFIDENNK